MNCERCGEKTRINFSNADVKLCEDCYDTVDTISSNQPKGDNFDKYETQCSERSTKENNNVAECDSFLVAIPEEILKKIKYAWIAGLISISMTVVFTFISMSGISIPDLDAGQHGVIV